MLLLCGNQLTILLKNTSITENMFVCLVAPLICYSSLSVPSVGMSRCGLHLNYYTTYPKVLTRLHITSY